ncbi:G-patch domain-containing protein [Ceratobasidium sp. AG-Ba]|nr:G-patch domain-containing protein [Ceratobasidium sp. AG-Ba]
MSDEEEDYLSDKFLASLESSKPPATGNASYAERRRIAQRESERKRLEGRIKSRRELEEEARREGLSRSLFEKEKDAEQQGSGGGSKAMSMMLRMGFKPGESLGKKEEPKLKSEEPPEPGDEKEEVEEGGKKLKSGHLTEPLPLAMWAGRKGLGLGKRAMSPPLTGSSKVTKVSAEEDAAEKSRNENFRSQARGEYEEKRNEGRLRAALRTRATLDEAQGIQFNVLQLNPTDPSSVPPALYDLLTRTSFDGLEEAPLAAKPGSRVLLGESDFDEDVGPGADRAVAARLKEQMKADSLRPLEETLDEDKTLAMKDALQEEAAPKEGSTVNDQPDFDEDTVDAAREYLQRNVQERLDTLLQYLRSKYHYCFWCGARYDSKEDLEQNCPGLDEDNH